MVFGHNIQFASGCYMIKNEMFFDNNVFRFIYSFHMPCLMLISGYFFGVHITKGKSIYNRIKTLFIPIMSWTMIPVAIIIYSRYQDNIGFLLIFSECFSCFVRYYWFLWAVIFSSMIIWGVHKVAGDNLLILITIGAVLLFIPRLSDLWIFMYPYYTIGFLFYTKKIEVERYIKDFGIHILICCSFLFIILLMFYTKEVYIYTTGVKVGSILQLGIDLYRYIVGFIGSLTIIMIWYRFHPIIEMRFPVVNKILEYLGRTTLIVYVIDTLLNSYVIPYITKEFSLNYYVTIFETIFVLLLCTAIDFFINKSLFLKRVLKGAR